jgi:hypothetical protein
MAVDACVQAPIYMTCHSVDCRWLLLVLAIAIMAVAHSFWIIIGKNPSGNECTGRTHCA